MLLDEMAVSASKAADHAYETSGRIHKKIAKAMNRKSNYDHEEVQMHQKDAADYHRIALHLDKGEHGKARRVYNKMDTAARDYAPAALARHLGYDVNEGFLDEFGVCILEAEEMAEAETLTETHAMVLDLMAAKTIRSEAGRQKKMAHSNHLHDLASNVENGNYKLAQKTIKKMHKDVVKGIPHVTKLHLQRVGVMEETESQLDELDTKTLQSYVRKNLNLGIAGNKRDEGLHRATNKLAQRSSDSALSRKVNHLGNVAPSDHKNPYEYDASREALKQRGIHKFAGRTVREK